MIIRRSLIASLVLSAAVLMPSFAQGASTSPTEQNAIDYLLSKQGTDGSWVPQVGPGVTALVVKGLLQAGHSPEEPAVQKGLDFIESTRQSDGGFYTVSNATYNTAIVLSTLAALPEKTRAKYQDQITAAQNFLKSIQSGASGAATDSQGKPVNKEHPWFGGWGYGQGAKLRSGQRPDLSNTQFVIEALRTSGVPASDPSIQNALVFLSRVQAYEGNSMPWAKGRDDGGFIYSMGYNKKHNFYGESEGGDRTDRDGNEVLVDYGSMTYSGLKSLLYADVKKNDPRVQAALRWIRGNYTLEVNPGLNNRQGLFYYYHVFATALKALGEPTITDGKGVQHDWRRELQETLAAKQKPDGSFVNPADRWMESNPVLVTSYVVLTLEAAR